MKESIHKLMRSKLPDISYLVFWMRDILVLDKHLLCNMKKNTPYGCAPLCLKRVVSQLLSRLLIFFTGNS